MKDEAAARDFFSVRQREDGIAMISEIAAGVLHAALLVWLFVALQIPAVEPGIGLERLQRSA